MSRKDYEHGYYVGRKFNRSVKTYIVGAFIAGMLAEFLLAIIFGIIR